MERIGHPSEIVSVGETLTLRVISLDMERHRIGLSLEKVDSDQYASIDMELLQEELVEDESEDEIEVETEPEDEIETEIEAENEAEDAEEPDAELEGEAVPEGVLEEEASSEPPPQEA